MTLPGSIQSSMMVISVGGSVRYGNKECFAALNITEHPLTLNRVSPILLAPTELALIYFDDLVRTTNF